jgi:hypothetical protein
VNVGAPVRVIVVEPLSEPVPNEDADAAERPAELEPATA